MRGVQRLVKEMTQMRYSCLVLVMLGILLIVGGVLLASGILGPLRQSALPQPRIYAYRDWQSMGVQLHPGDLVHIRVRGEWLYTPGEYHGPEGHARYPAPMFYPIPHVAGGVLIGRIGETGQPFVVGRGGSIGVGEAGLLCLRINDDLLSDNAGYVTVEIEVTRAATPVP